MKADYGPAVRAQVVAIVGSVSTRNRRILLTASEY